MKSLYSIARGRSRIVILIPLLHIAIKFARTQIFSAVIGYFGDLCKGPGFRKTAWPMLKYKWKHIAVKGISENLQENRLYKEFAIPLLVPTYFSLGFVNIQKLHTGRQPSGSSFLMHLELLTEGNLYVHNHSFNPDNFKVGDSGKFYLVDYGEPKIAPVLKRFGYRIHYECSESHVLSRAEEAQVTMFVERFFEARNSQTEP